MRDNIQFLWDIFEKLRRRRMPLGVDDFQNLRRALYAGFGWESPDALCRLCCLLWAKSEPEQDQIRAVFEELRPSDWEWRLPATAAGDQATGAAAPDEPERETAAAQPTAEPDAAGLITEVQPYRWLPGIDWSGVQLPARTFTLLPQFPLTFREIGQAWRRLRRAVREGAPEEFDVNATIARRCQTGVASPVVLRPRRRNRARLLLLVDRDGSMTPFHPFVEEVCRTAQQAGRLAHTAIYYFHDAPTEQADERILESESLRGDLFPRLDAALDQIEPCSAGEVYHDPALTEPRALATVLDQDAPGADVVIISDAGAARGRYDPLRLLHTLAFLKALRRATPRWVWLNPLTEWGHSTAAQLARHAPMFPLTRAGLHQAVNVLHGRPYMLERPL